MANTIKLGLERMGALLQCLGNPHRSFTDVIHIGGTNGKGSCSAMLSSILSHGDISVGCFTSPAVLNKRETIQVNNQWIPPDHLLQMQHTVNDAANHVQRMTGDQPTGFEVQVATMLCYFQERAVNTVVVEVGVGGLRDATNVFERPTLSVITPISLDHVGLIGDTIAEIATEKSGIIKVDCPVVVAPQTYPQTVEIMKKAVSRPDLMTLVDSSQLHVNNRTESGSEVVYKGMMYSLPLLGNHQLTNCLTVLTVLDVLKQQPSGKQWEFLTPQYIQQKLCAMPPIPCRMEMLHCKHSLHVLLDGAHNFEGIQNLGNSIQAHFPHLHETYSKVVVVLAMLQDKTQCAVGGKTAAGQWVNEVISKLPPQVSVICTVVPNARVGRPGAVTTTAETLRAEIQTASPALSPHIVAEEHWTHAVEMALASSSSNGKQLVIFSGSLYFCGAVRDYIGMHAEELGVTATPYHGIDEFHFTEVQG